MSTDRKVAHNVVNGEVTFDELEQAFGEVIKRNPIAVYSLDSAGRNILVLEHCGPSVFWGVS